MVGASSTVPFASLCENLGTFSASSLAATFWASSFSPSPYSMGRGFMSTSYSVPMWRFSAEFDLPHGLRSALFREKSVVASKGSMPLVMSVAIRFLHFSVEVCGVERLRRSQRVIQDVHLLCDFLSQNLCELPHACQPHPASPVRISCRVRREVQMLIFQPRNHVRHDLGEDFPSRLLREFFQRSRIMNRSQVLDFLLRQLNLRRLGLHFRYHLGPHSERRILDRLPLSVRPPTLLPQLCPIALAPSPRSAVTDSYS